jgi:hypothetical protein
MILISHRGNLNGKIVERENHPDYIDEAIKAGFDVEIDIRLNDGVLYLGHDEIQYEVSVIWLKDRIGELWIHCKNIEALEFFNEIHYEFNYFWHEEDTATLTSLKYIWAYPGKQPIERSIAVMPEIYNDKLKACMGICSDYIEKYRK